MASKDKKKPNIIFMLSDDQGAWAMGYAGNKHIITPNFNRLAAEGMVFTNSFCASPVCSPARATILTGRTPSQHGVQDWIRLGHYGENAIDYLKGYLTYPEVLKENGYECAFSGKWHLGDVYAVKNRFPDHTYVHLKGAGHYYNAPMVNMLEEAVEFVRKNSRTKTIINDNGQRADKPEYPIKAVREAILNALVHRDYSIHTENVPIRIEMYRDRMEIINSGGLYGKISIDALGKVRPETRNAVLANMLELLNITENRYSGIPTMRSEFANAGLPAPLFSVVHGEFKVVMKNGLFAETMPVGDSLIEFCSTPRTRAEIVAFVGKSKNHVMSQIVAPLVAEGKLKMTMPDKPKSSNQKFIKT